MSLNEGRECSLGDLRIKKIYSCPITCIYVASGILHVNCSNLLDKSINVHLIEELASSGSWSDRPAGDIQAVVVACTQYLP